MHCYGWKSINFKPKQKWEFELEGENYITEHQQVRECLKDHEKIKASKKLKELHDLRKKADYKMFNPLTEEDTKKAIENMENIFNELEF